MIPKHKKIKKRDVMCCQVWCGVPYSAFNPSKSTHTAVSSKYTHTVNTHPEQWAAIFAVAPGEQSGVRCLAQGPHLSFGIDRERERSFTPATQNLWVASLTL